MDEATGTVTELVGVYDADGTLRGELAYLWRQATGRAHCGLCDITHGRLRRRRSFDASAAALPVRFTLLHRDEQPAAVAAASDGRLPCVAARTTAGSVVVLLGAGELDACRGDPRRLVDAIRSAVDDQGLRWPGAAASGQVAGGL